jgi:hypothetical protein
MNARTKEAAVIMLHAFGIAYSHEECDFVRSEKGRKPPSIHHRVAAGIGPLQTPNSSVSDFQSVLFSANLHEV